MAVETGPSSLRFCGIVPDQDLCERGLFPVASAVIDRQQDLIGQVGFF
jgi:hypothetical protein